MGGFGIEATEQGPQNRVDIDQDWGALLPICVLPICPLAI